MKRLIYISIVLSIVLSACAPAPATDWCYTYSFIGGLPSGFSLAYGYAVSDGLRGDITGDLYVEYSGPAVSPSYISVALSNPGSSGTVGYVEGDWWGSSFSSTTLSTGETLAVASTSGSGTNKYIYVYIPTSARVTSLTFHGNGANPFPDNDCPPAATPTPSATSTPAPPPSVDFGAIDYVAPLNLWLVVLLPLVAIGLIPVAMKILMFIVGMLWDAFGGRP